MGKEPSEIREEIEQTRDEMGETVEALGHRADVKTRAKENIAGKRDRLKQRVTGTTSRVDEATPDADQLKAGAKRAAGVAQENPIGLALGSLAVGFLAGMLVPLTRAEDEKIGPMADEVKARVKETGQEALERSKEVAQSAAQSAKETAQQRGQQQAEELRGTAQEKARDAKEDAKRAAPRSTRP